MRTWGKLDPRQAHLPRLWERIPLGAPTTLQNEVKPVARFRRHLSTQENKALDDLKAEKLRQREANRMKALATGSSGGLGTQRPLPQFYADGNSANSSSVTEHPGTLLRRCASNKVRANSSWASSRTVGAPGTTWTLANAGRPGFSIRCGCEPGDVCPHFHGF